MKVDFQNIVPTILIVDDNPKNLQIVALILRELKYKIIISVDGPGAIDMVKRARPDIILLDVMMPGMDGFEACRIIKSKLENDNIPVIFLTALSDKANIVKGFEMGGVDYVLKPFNKEELITRIKTHLELKFTRDELQRTTNNLSELNALKDKMFSIIGHDLRSPVGSIKMMLDLISMNPIVKGNSEFLESFDLLAHTADELYALLENILGWAKSQSGNLAFVGELVDVASVIRSVFLLNKSNLEHKMIGFEQNVKDKTQVFADLNMLKMVLRNIISNAIKFTNKGGTIIVSAEVIENQVCISVADNGIGISKENISKLFDDKQHYSTYGTNNEAGSGIGLILCHNYLKNSNGRMWVESEVGIGTTFKIELPASDLDQNTNPS